MKKIQMMKQAEQQALEEATPQPISSLNRRPLLPPIASHKPLQQTLPNPELVKQIHLNHFVLDNRPRTSPETLYVVGHNLNQAVQKEAKEMCRLLGEVRRRQWTKESAGGARPKEQQPPLPAPIKKRCSVSINFNFTNSKFF
jgi:hypothetical protein